MRGVSGEEREGGHGREQSCHRDQVGEGREAEVVEELVGVCVEGLCRGQGDRGWIDDVVGDVEATRWRVFTDEGARILCRLSMACWQCG